MKLENFVGEIEAECQDVKVVVKRKRKDKSMKFYEKRDPVDYVIMHLSIAVGVFMLILSANLFTGGFDSLASIFSPLIAMIPN